MPAMYSRALTGSTSPANSTSKNRIPNPVMVNGLISQLTTSVMHRPFGRRPTSRTEAKSMFTIIG